jgi:hypothetical protein
MPKKWLMLLAFGSVGCAAFLLLIAGGLSLSRASSIAVSEAQPKPKVLPQSAFRPEKLSYDAIGTDLFTLNYTPPKMQLPDLRKLLTYYGPNGRPDANLDSKAVHFGLANNHEQGAMAPGDRLYLLYDRTQHPPRYTFSPGNSPTTLWIEIEPEDESASVSVYMVNEEGEIVQEPKNRAEFSLAQKEFTRFNRGQAWDIGQNRVDGTLLARQKAKWYGSDKFFERHGGEEYEEEGRKQRIDFGEKDDVYSVFVDEGDVLVWNGCQWSEATPGPETFGKPLMQLKKVSERLLTFELWNPEGSNKVALNLLKNRERWIPEQLKDNFKFVSARTRSQYVFEVGNERMTLTPKDWLVKTDGGWEKLNTVEEIDAYVERKLQGPLFVFDGVEKRDDRQVLVGTLFNASRTDMQQVELDVPQSTITVITVPKVTNEMMGNGNETEIKSPYNDN